MVGPAIASKSPFSSARRVLRPFVCKGRVLGRLDVAPTWTIGNNQPVALLRFIAVLEACLGKPAEKHLLPLQPGDVPATCAEVDDLMRDTGFRPRTPIEDGIPRFVAWYREYYRGAR